MKLINVKVISATRAQKVIQINLSDNVRSKNEASRTVSSKLD